jgi:hypothetical protein
MDLAIANGQLWVAGYNGMVYHLSSAGAILSSFDTGQTGPGIATDGTFLYTSGGYGSGTIDKWNPNGTLAGTIMTGLTDALGLAYDAASQNLWVGGSDLVSVVDLSGNIGSQYSIAGAHTALEIGDIGQAPPTGSVPEPTSITLMLSAPLVLAAFRKRLAARQ